LIFALVKSTFDRKIEIHVLCTLEKQYNNIDKTGFILNMAFNKISILNYTSLINIVKKIMHTLRITVPIVYKFSESCNNFEKKQGTEIKTIFFRKQRNLK